METDYPSFMHFLTATASVT